MSIPPMMRRWLITSLSALCALALVVLINAGCNQDMEQVPGVDGGVVNPISDAAGAAMDAPANVDAAIALPDAGPLPDAGDGGLGDGGLGDGGLGDGGLGDGGLGDAGGLDAPTGS